VHLSKFRPAVGLANAHLMTLAPLAILRTFPLTDRVSERLLIDVDKLNVLQQNKVVVHLHTPEQLHNMRNHYAPLTQGLARHLILVVHGLEGSVESTYVKGVCEKALSLGFSVARINLRNCGDTLHLAQGLYNAGMSNDVVAIANELKRRFGFEKIFMSGFSLGGNIVLKAAGELGQKQDNIIEGVCAVCPPVDLDACVSAIEQTQNRLYEQGFLVSLKEKIKAKNKLFPGRFDTERLATINSLRAFDNAYTAPDAGYTDAASYYFGASALRVVSHIKMPALVIAAIDDPLVPISSFRGSQFSEAVTLDTPEKGGHVGFISAGDIHLSDLDRSTAANRSKIKDRFWSEWRVVQFFFDLSHLN
jgi:predicted alpha/beta-fold hydrolase